MPAIKEAFDRLIGRTTEKVDLTSKGDKLGCLLGEIEKEKEELIDTTNQK